MSFLKQQSRLSLEAIIYSKKAIWFIILLGLLFRLVPYLENRSLWLDEASISLNIIVSSYSELLLPLDMDQGAPPGFLYAEKISTQLFGVNEYALRLFPLLTGLISVLVFFLLARQTLDKEVLLLGLFLFSVSTTSVYFASEVKQYASDVLIAMFLIILAIGQLQKAINVKKLIVFAIAGIIAITFSHPSVFILAGIGTTMIFSSMINRNYKNLIFYLTVSAIWLAFFGLIYFLHFRFLEQNNLLMKYWNDAFMPFPPTSKEDLKWFFLTSQQVFKNPMGYTIGGLASFFFILGGIYQWKKNKDVFFIFATPIFFTLVASGLHKFPFAERVILFLQPVFIIFIVSGIYLMASSSKKYKYLLYLISILFIIGPMTFKTLAYVVKPERIEIKDILAELKKEYKPGDIIVVEFLAERAYRFYYQKYELPLADIIYNKKSDQYNHPIKINESNRIWYLVTYHEEGAEPKLFIPKYLDMNGIKIKTFNSTNAACYLYNVTEKESSKLH